MDFDETLNFVGSLRRRSHVARVLSRIVAAGSVAVFSASALGTQAHWSLYALGGYSLAFPSAPQAPTSQKLTDDFRRWVATQGSSSYVFSLTRVAAAAAAATPEALLRQCVNGLLSSGKTTIVSERDILLQGWMGVEVLYRVGSESEVQLRAFVVKDQILNMLVSRPVGSAPPDGFTRFFDSVQMPSDVGKGTLSQPGPKIAKFDLEASGFSVKIPTNVRSEVVKPNGSGAVEMHQFAAVYLNRIYLGFVMDPPADAKVDLDNDVTGKAAQAVNATIVGMLQQAPLKPGSRDTPLGKAWTLDFNPGNGRTGHVETYVKNNHTYSIVAIVPTSMLPSDEVKGFFSSVTLPPKK